MTNAEILKAVKDDKVNGYVYQQIRNRLKERDAFREAAMDAKTTLETWAFEQGLTNPEAHQLERLRKLLPSPANTKDHQREASGGSDCS